MSTAEAVPIPSGDIRQDARGARLSMKHKKEEDLRKGLLLQARETCKETTRAFGECANEHGLMVVFKCQQHNKAMIDCINVHYNDDKFHELLISKGFDVSDREKKSYKI